MDLSAMDPDESLHEVAARGDLERVRELLAQGHDVNGSDDEHETPLHIAARSDHLDIARCLVDHGADLNEHNNSMCCTPLHYAVINRKFRICEYLVACGADMTIKTSCGNTALHLIGFLHSVVDPLSLKNTFASMEDPRPLFAIDGANGDTPLHQLRDVAFAKCLIEYSFDPPTSGVQSTWICPTLFSTRNTTGETPVEKAAMMTKNVTGYYRKHYAAVEKYLDSYESLPLVDLSTMKYSPGLNKFQRFLTRRIYYTTLPKLGPDVALRVMAYLSPADVMK